MKCDKCGQEIVKSQVSWQTSSSNGYWEPVEVEAREALGYGPVPEWTIDSPTRTTSEILHTPIRCDVCGKTGATWRDNTVKRCNRCEALIRDAEQRGAERERGVSGAVAAAMDRAATAAAVNEHARCVALLRGDIHSRIPMRPTRRNWGSEHTEDYYLDLASDWLAARGPGTKEDT